ncbi:MAG: hypothetical protein QF664_06510 [Dehalococcoidia bacterium]|jgi:dienelactone hydrolase|nr:hypothetical protein [Dehalococcoidia bacterium]
MSGGTWSRVRALLLRRRAAAFLAPVVLLVALAFAWPSLDAWARSAALFSDVIVRAPVRPITWFTDAPSRETLEWGEQGGHGLLTRPANGRSAPALVLILGADPAAADDRRVVRLVDSLARTGFVVLFPLSDELDAKHVGAVEVERLVGAFEALERDPGVRADRIAFVGLSAGGSLAIVAASDERIAARVWSVTAIGPYFDAVSLAASALAGAYRSPGGIVPWTPERVTVEVVQQTLLSSLPDGQRQQLARADLDTALSLLHELPAEQQAALRAVSPGTSIDGLRAPLYLLHDRNDRFVPWTESEALAAAHQPAVYHRLDLFEHVEPQPGNVPVLLRDGWRLLRLFARIYRDAR